MKKNIWKLLAVLLATSLLVFASCGDDDDDSSPVVASEASSSEVECEETYDVAYANLATFILYFRDLEEGLRRFGAENCWNFTSADAAYVIEDQVAQIEDMVTQGVDLIIASPGDLNALKPAFQAAADAGIPVLSTGDSVKDESLEIGFIGAIWKDEGVKQTEWTVKKLGGPGTLARIGGPGGSEYVEGRLEGFNEVLAEHPEIEVVFNQSADSYTQEEGLRLAQDALTANPDLDTIWADSDALALGAAQAVTEAGIDHATIWISGSDGEPAAFDQIRDGNGIDATIALHGLQWGNLTAEVAHEFLTTGSTGRGYFIQAPTELVDSDNIGSRTNEDLR
mgnify:FL=1|tara:strand:+ start:2685 stop:3698 length:1014 start_codon:yes stop_codon:yes gene_type:complete